MIWLRGVSNTTRLMSRRSSAEESVSESVRSAAAWQGAGALVLAEFAVGIVDDLRMAGRVERGGLRRGQLEIGRTQVGLQLLHRPRAQDGGGHRGPGGHPGQRDLGHGRAAVLGYLLHCVDDV